VLDVAMASGFASLRRFNDLFRTRYRMTPAELRRKSPVRHASDQLEFDLAYRPPYDWDAMLSFLERRAIPCVEHIEKAPGTFSRHGAYRRTVRIVMQGRTHAGWMAVTPSPKRAALRVIVSASLAGALPVVLARAKHLLDLSCHPEEIAASLGGLADAHPGLRLPGAMDGFEVAVRAILGQQVTVKAATTLAARFVAAFGEPIEIANAALSRLFPTPAVIAALDSADIARLGIVGARARAIVALAREVDSGALQLDPLAPVDATLAALQALPGVGPWTAEYIAMRALAWPDAFPHPDVAVLKAMRQRSAPRALQLSEAWRPWRAYAVLHLWKSLEASP
jgi:AraC family transcriptional regulator of adaptative response / DNA-3-methyladenine glycosylase II